MRHLIHAWLVFLCITGIFGGTAPALADTPRVLSLEQAISKTLERNPELAAARPEIGKAQAQKRQAGFYPNPELAFELENFAGSGAFSGTGNAERTLTLEQEILLGGKIKKRRQVADGELKNTQWELQILEQDIRSEVKQAYIEVTGDQNALALQQKLVDLSVQIHETVRQKVDA